MRHKKRHTILLILLMCCTLGVWAVPARRITIVVNQPDSTQLTITMQGDEHFHCYVTPDGIPVVYHEGGYYYARIENGGVESSGRLAHEATLRSAEEQAFVDALPDVQSARATRMQRARGQRTAAQSGSEVPTTGEVSIPVLLVQYADVKFSSANPKSLFENRVNGENYTEEGGNGSIREYFIDQSGGQFTPHFDIIGPITLSHEMAYYGDNDTSGADVRPREMVSEACRKAYKELNVNFKSYDNNSDGYVDILYVIYAGYGEASNPDMLESTIWPHQWSLEKPLTLGGVNISRYACNNELDGYTGNTLDGIGTFCHEFSHCLGLPDFYDTTGSGTIFGMDSWSVMDYGCYNNNGHTPCAYTAYEKDYLGWKALVELRNPTTVTLKALSEGGEAYKIVNEANTDEYYVVEYCQKTGWNAHAPAEGMIIMHVDYLASAWQDNTVNNDPAHRRMTIIPADGKLSIQTLATDVWPGKSGKTQLTAKSTPAAKVYTGEYMNKDITNISMGDGMVTFSFMQGALPSPLLHEPEDISPSGFTVRWDAIDGIPSYEVSLDRLEENPYLIDEDFDEITEGYTDIGLTLDSYTRQAGWVGGEIYGLDGALRIGGITNEGILMTPQLACDSTALTVIFTIRKSNPGSNDAHMVMAIADSEWGNSMYGYRLTIDDETWGTYFVVIDTIGKNSFLYLETCDNEETPERESIRVDLDDLHVLPGDRTEELTSGEENNINIRRAYPMQATAHRGQIKSSPAYTADKTETAERTAAKANGAQTGKRYDEIPVHTVKVTGNSYTFDELDGGLYRCRVRSVKGDVASLYSNAVEVQIKDSILPQTDATPYIYIDQDSMYIQVPDSVNAYYTTDGSRPTTYSKQYTGPIRLNSKVTIRAIARRTGHRSSRVTSKTNWFAVDGATYRVTSSIAHKVSLSETMDGNTDEDYAGHYTIGNSIQDDTASYILTGIDSYAFRNATGLRSVTLEGDSLQHIGKSIFHGCTSLSAVVWDVDLPVRDELFDNSSYYNLLLFLPDTAQMTHPLIEAQRITVIKEGKSGPLTLHSGKPFYTPLPFTAERVTYQREFSQQTGFQSSGGWETIALPFDVEQITHETVGAIAPFGAKADNHFWLAEPSTKGFNHVTKIRANKPYIIAMPNNPAYGTYALTGTVTFSAEEAMVYATQENMGSAGKDFSLMTTYERIEPTEGIYAINLNETYGVYSSGSIFIAGMYPVDPFSAYIVPTSQQAPAKYCITLLRDEETGEEQTPTFSVEVRDRRVHITTPDERAVTVYDNTGRKVCTIQCAKGTNTTPPLEPGMYIIEKRKIYVQY